MRKITEQVVAAFLAGKPKTVGNTSTDGRSLVLHGNPIAQRLPDGLRITLAGWNTPTTRERLNGLPGVSVNVKRGQAYLNGLVWDGDWIILSPEL